MSKNYDESGFCGKCCLLAMTFIPVLIAVVVMKRESLFIFRKHPNSFPKPNNVYWGNIKNSDNDDEKIYSFNVNDVLSLNSDAYINMDKYRELWLSDNTVNRFKGHEMKNEKNKLFGMEWGIDGNDFKDLVGYWDKHFDFKKYLKKINEFKHYQTKIQGLNIHYIKQTSKGNPKSNNVSKCDAIIILHGWPSTFWEFHKIIQPLSDKLSKIYSNNIDIIVPSLPGYGFSESSDNHDEFNIMAVASILKELMEKRLQYKNYVTIGGDWGFIITTMMGVQTINEPVNERKLIGLGLNNAFSSPPLYDLLLLQFNNSLINKYYFCKYYNVTMDELAPFSPYINNVFNRMIDMTGYQHIHSTRPNTIGTALESSPVGILAWIYEKYLSWSDTPNNYIIKGNQRIISGQLNWDDILVTNYIYWLTGHITSSIMYYAQNMKLSYTQLSQLYIPDDMPVGIIDWNDDIIKSFKGWYKYTYHNIIYYNDELIGGHFPALEYPERYIDNTLQFMAKLNE